MQTIKNSLRNTVLFLVFAFLSSAAHATSVVGFLKFGGITYTSLGGIGRELHDTDLGAEITKVKFKLTWNGIMPAPPPAFGPDEAYAASLDVGTSVYAVKGYKPTFRLAAHRRDRLVLYEADTNPKARTGTDLLDLNNKVAYISVNSAEDGRTELAAIKGPALVEKLVRATLAAPVNRENNDHSGPRYFIAFHFRDGTATSRAYGLDSGELARGIMLPPEFARAVRQALKSASGSP